jgi:hypothetical protein
MSRSQGLGEAEVRSVHDVHHHGCRAIALESFLVRDGEGPLRTGEFERARRWGAQLACRRPGRAAEDEVSSADHERSRA